MNGIIGTLWKHEELLINCSDLGYRNLPAGGLAHSKTVKVSSSLLIGAYRKTKLIKYQECKIMLSTHLVKHVRKESAYYDM